MTFPHCSRSSRSAWRHGHFLARARVTAPLCQEAVAARAGRQRHAHHVSAIFRHHLWIAARASCRRRLSKSCRDPEVSRRRGSLTRRALQGRLRLPRAIPHRSQDAGARIHVFDHRGCMAEATPRHDAGARRPKSGRGNPCAHGPIEPVTRGQAAIPETALKQFDALSKRGANVSTASPRACPVSCGTRSRSARWST
jgi:hypothetical protein